jgi:hypothetical protein
VGKKTDLVHKAEMAMPAMQRATWEQGVAMQSLLSGIKGGWISNDYRMPADKMRTAANSKLDEPGIIQGVCGSPEFDHAGTATKGQALYIMMEVAHRKLIG